MWQSSVISWEVYRNQPLTTEYLVSFQAFCTTHLEKCLFFLLSILYWIWNIVEFLQNNCVHESLSNQINFKILFTSIQIDDFKKFWYRRWLYSKYTVINKQAINWDLRNVFYFLVLFVFTGSVFYSHEIWLLWLLSKKTYNKIFRVCV